MASKAAKRKQRIKSLQGRGKTVPRGLGGPGSKKTGTASRKSLAGGRTSG